MGLACKVSVGQIRLGQVSAGRGVLRTGFVYHVDSCCGVLTFLISIRHLHLMLDGFSCNFHPWAAYPYA